MLRSEPKTGVHMPMTRARKTSSKLNSGDNMQSRKQQTGAPMLMIRARKT